MCRPCRNNSSFIPNDGRSVCFYRNDVIDPPASEPASEAAWGPAGEGFPGQAADLGADRRLWAPQPHLLEWVLLQLRVLEAGSLVSTQVHAQPRPVLPDLFLKQRELPCPLFPAPLPSTAAPYLSSRSHTPLGPRLCLRCAQPRAAAKPWCWLLWVHSCAASTASASWHLPGCLCWHHLGSQQESPDWPSALSPKSKFLSETSFILSG